MGGILRGLKGRARWLVLQQHTLTVFEKTMDKYMRGEVSADAVSKRRLKLKKRGVQHGRRR